MSPWPQILNAICLAEAQVTSWASCPQFLPSRTPTLGRKDHLQAGAEYPLSDRALL